MSCSKSSVVIGTESPKPNLLLICPECLVKDEKYQARSEKQMIWHRRNTHNTWFPQLPTCQKCSSDKPYQCMTEEGLAKHYIKRHQLVLNQQTGDLKPMEVSNVGELTRQSRFDNKKINTK